MTKRVSKIIENVIFIGTGCLALSGLLFVDYVPNGGFKPSTATEAARKTDGESAAERSRAQELISKLPGLEGLSLQVGHQQTSLGATVFTAGRSKSHGVDDVVIADYSKVGHPERLSFIDAAGRPLLILRQSGGAFVLQFTGTRSDTIQTLADGQPLEIVVLSGGR